MKIACLCPTYKRPDCLQNVLACFVRQNYPPADCRLFMIDDAGQFDPHVGPRWSVASTTDRFPDLPTKFDQLAAMAELWDPDVLSIWEDDDVYLPNHLATIKRVIESGQRFVAPSEVYSTYGLPAGEYQREGAKGRFHASWSMTAELYREVGGWPKTERLDFDQQFGAQLRGPGFAYHELAPTYVYRWGNGVYHGSQAGEEGFRKLWDSLGDREAPHVGELIPQFDRETQMIFENLGI